MKKTILITWGLGYIWSHTIVELANSWYTLVIIDNLSNTYHEVLAQLETLTGTNLPFFQGDIRDKSFLESVFSQYSFDAVLHFAAKKSVSESMELPFEYYDNNVQGTLILTQVMVSYGVRNLLFSGTCAVYAPSTLAPYDEQSAVWPESVYAISKRMTEELCEGLYKTQSLSTLVLRYFNPIGNHSSGSIGEQPRGVPQNLMPYLIQVAQGNREELLVYGDDYDTPDGTCVRDYIHVLDLAQAHVKALDYLLRQEDYIYDIINIGTGTGTSVLEMIHHAEQIIGKAFPYRIVERRSWDLAVVYGKVEKAEQLLWRRAQKTISDGIHDMLSFIPLVK